MGLQESGANKYPDQLSGGTQQRAAIAQALIMRTLWAETGTTILFVTHNIAEALFILKTAVEAPGIRQLAERQAVVRKVIVAGPVKCEAVDLRYRSLTFRGSVMRSFYRAARVTKR
jgi:ABC-type nitrate/sulfonate/bicarbonate transport system ATPase subunit